MKLNPSSGVAGVRRYCLAALILMTGPADALEVVADFGGSDATAYFRSFEARPPRVQAPVPRHTVSEADMLPVKPRSLQPGLVESRTLSAPGLRPFFMVGDDDLSLRWLAARAQALGDMGAVGMAVQVSTPAALARIRAVAPQLKILPTSGDDVAGRLGIKNYPVLITENSIEQ